MAAIARKDGHPTVAGVLPGDRLVSIDGRAVSGLTRGQLLEDLHGQPGRTLDLIVTRKGEKLKVQAPVTGF